MPKALEPPAPLLPVKHGPTGMPALTLGWEVLKWTNQNLLQPDGPDAGEPWVYTGEQVYFILWWYAIDERGRFIYRRSVFRRMKGHGKDPLGASLCVVEFVGPCRFGGFTRAGQPIAIPHPAAWVQTAAVSKDQTRNTMTLFPGMISPRLQEEHHIDIGKEIVYAHGGKARIEAVTSSPRALEGGRGTFILKNETHHWIKANEGLEMSAVIDRNAAKSRDGSSRVMAITNAHDPGEESDARNDYNSRDARGVLYDNLEAPEGLDITKEADVRVGLALARGDSTWLDIDRLTEEILDPKSDPVTSRRYYFNQSRAAESRAFPVEKWIAGYKPDYMPPKGAFVVGGFDGSKSNDWTAFIGTEISTGFQWPVGIWVPKYNPSSGQWEIPEDEVDSTVELFFSEFDVWRFNCDPFWWKEWVAHWAGKYNRPGKERVVSFNTTLYKKMAYTLLDYRNAMADGTVTHNGNELFQQGILNARRQYLNFTDDNGDPMWIIQKESPDSSEKIDPAMAGALSWEARTAAITLGAKPTPKGYSVYVPGDD